jgi:pimeloyl-ACP methyl ester carboxylesterase
MLLVHGAGSNHLVWPSNLRRDTTNKMIAIDLPGHGRSTGVPEQSIERYAYRTLQFLDEMGIYRVFLAGHSMGGAIGLHICKTNPERLIGLALLSTGTRVLIPRRTLDLFANPNNTQEAIASLEPLLFGSDASPSLRRQVIKSMQNNRAGVLYSDWLACSGIDIQQSCGEISKPVWIAAGSEDKITPPDKVRQLFSQIPRSRIKFFAGAGHMLILEKPTEISNWLLSLPGKLIKK